MAVQPADQSRDAGCYRFGEFLLDPASRRLMRGARPLPLTIKAFDTLLLLVEQSGAIVSKDALLHGVWPGVTVEDNNLNQAVSALRKALGDTTSPRRFILTVPGRGYRFLPPVAIVGSDSDAPVVAAPSEPAVAPEPPPAHPLPPESAPPPVPAVAIPHAPRSWLDTVRAGWQRMLLASSMLSVFGMGWWGLGAVRSHVPGIQGAELMAAVPVTTEAGDESWPSLSPDGTKVVFSWRQAASMQTQLAVKVLGSDAVTPITSGRVDDFSPTWSPDGRFIAFLRGVREPELSSQLCVVSALGGPPRVLHTQSLGMPPGLAWWEARNALVFSTRDALRQPFHLAALDLETLRVEPLTVPPAAPLLSAPGDSQAAISPDGGTLAFVRETHEGMDVFVMSLATKAERQVTFERRPIAGLAWHPDGRSLIVSSTRGGVEALHRVWLATGRIARLPHIDDGATAPTVDRRGRLAFRQAQCDTNLYRVELRGGRAVGPPRRIVASSRLDDTPHISRDGQRIAFQSSRSGSPEIWIADSDGANQRQVTFLNRQSSRPRWSPDGRHIAFTSPAPGQARADIWVIDARGGTARPLTQDASYDTTPTWSADGTSLYFLSDRSGAWEIWNVPAHGGLATRVTTGGGLRAQESHDGAALYFATDVPEVWRRALDGRSPDEPVIRFPQNTHWGGDWTVAGRGLYYLSDHPTGMASIDFLPFQSPRLARPTRVASFTARPSHGVSFSVAPDESWLVWSQEDYRNSDILFQNISDDR